MRLVFWIALAAALSLAALSVRDAPVAFPLAGDGPVQAAFR